MFKLFELLFHGETASAQEYPGGQAQRTDLKSRRQLLQTKLDILNRSSGQLLDQPQMAERQKLQQRMEQVEAQFKELGAEHTVLQQHLELIGQTLVAPEQQLSCHRETLYIDAMQYVRAPQHAKARAVPVQMLHNAKVIKWRFSWWPFLRIVLLFSGRAGCE